MNELMLQRAHVAAFASFGGVPYEILSDNMLTVTIGRDSHNQPVLQREFRDFAGLYGFVVRCARAHRAKTKGKVERAIGFIQTSFLPGRNIALGGQSKSHTDVQLKTAHESVGTSKPHA